MSGLRRAYADGRWGQVHYREYPGPAATAHPPLLCLHQTPKSGWEFEAIMPALGAGRTVIAPDTPGYGASDGPPAPVRIEDYAQEIAAFMAGLGYARFDVMGVHTGAVVATELALASPDRVRRPVLVGLPAYDAAARLARLERLKSYPRPQADISHVERLWAMMQGIVDPRASVAWRHRSLAENLRAGDRAPWGYEAVHRYDLLAALAHVHQATLVLNPEDDLAALTPVGAALLPHGRSLDLPGVKHGLFALETERLAALITAFLDAPDGMEFAG